VSCRGDLVKLGWSVPLKPDAQRKAGGACLSLRSTMLRPNTGFQLTPLGGEQDRGYFDSWKQLDRVPDR
jgi:hypothetical protein